MRDALTRFTRSMSLDYERWREGASYDLAALDALGPSERLALVAGRLAPARDWRDVEALAHLHALGGAAADAARAALRAALDADDDRVRLAVLRYAPGLVSEPARVAALVRATRTATSYGGLSELVAHATACHPPAVMDALFRATLVREGPVAVHLAALLAYLHGRATSPFDWALRPLFLRFHAADRAGRDEAFRALCTTLGVPPAPRLAAVRAEHPGDPLPTPE